MAKTSKNLEAAAEVILLDHVDIHAGCLTSQDAVSLEERALVDG